MNKEKSQKNNTKPSLSKFAHLPSLKKSSKDYGKLTVEALKRQKD